MQEPRVSLVPKYATSTGKEAIQLAALADLHLDPWQADVLTDSLGERTDGKWAAFMVGLVVARQNGKDSILEARELAELYLISQLAGPRTIIHSAHLFSTALEHFRRLSARVKDTPELAKRVKHRGSRMVGIKESHGEESIELEDGSRILFAARTRGGRRGFSIDLLIWNEAMELPDAVVGAQMPAISARTGPEFLPGPQVWLTGSAVNQQTMPHGVQLARVRERGHAQEKGSLAYFEWSAPDDADAADPKAWAQANPGLGTRITVDHVAAERASMPAIEFDTERLGKGDWPPTSEDAARVISQDAWNALADPGSKIAKGHTFALDVEPGQAWATLSVAGERADGLYHIAIAEHRRDTGWIVERCKEYLERFPGASLIVDPRADLGALLTDLDEAGIQPVKTAANDYKDACGGFFQAVVEKRLRYMPPQPELDAAVAGARTKPLLDAWKWDRASGALITPLVSCTLALWGARTQGVPTVHSLGEIVERMRREREGQPEPTPDAPKQQDDGQRFVPLEGAPMAGMWR